MVVDKCGVNTHTVGINIEKIMIYDCQEKYVLDLSQDNFSKYCGLIILIWLLN